MRAALALLLLVVTFVSFPALAQPTEADRDAARALATAGFRLYSDGSYDSALERFRSAEKIIHAPPHVLYIARCLDKLGKMLEARDTYRQLLEDELAADAPPVFKKSRDQGTDELTKLLERMPRVTVDVGSPPPAGLRVTLDERELTAAELGTPIDLDPGEHQVVVTAQDEGEQRRSVTLAPGSNEVLEFRFGGDVPPGGEGEGEGEGGGEGGSIVGPMVLIGLGAAGLIVGAVTGGLALDKKGKLDALCPNKSCSLEASADGRQLEKDGRTLGAVSTVGFVVGGVAAAAGVTWLVFSLGDGDGDDGESEARIEPLVGPTQVGLRVTF